MAIKSVNKVLSISFLTLLLSQLSGCALFASSEEVQLAELTIIADKKLNPAADGRASPLVIRIYQLTETAKFDNSDFFALYENDQTLLAKDLLSQTELEITPGQELKTQLELKADTRFIAILAAFRDLDNAQWKDITTLVKDEITPLTIQLKGNTAKFSDK